MANLVCITDPKTKDIYLRLNDLVELLREDYDEIPDKGKRYYIQDLIKRLKEGKSQ